MQQIYFCVAIGLLHHLLVEVKQPGNPITEGNFEVAISFVLVERIIECVLKCGQGFFALISVGYVGVQIF
jgi:hypothetical protein